MKRKKIREKKGEVETAMNKVVYWTALLVTIVGNLVISSALIPFLIVLTNIELYLIVVVIGVAFGLLFNLLLKDIKNIDKKHYIIASVFIPGLAIINIFIITKLANYLANILEIKNGYHNPVIISIVYVIAFILPYVIDTQLGRGGKKS